MKRLPFQKRMCKILLVLSEALKGQMEVLERISKLELDMSICLMLNDTLFLREGWNILSFVVISSREKIFLV